jgi:hypothetical protein
MSIDPILDAEHAAGDDEVTSSARPRVPGNRPVPKVEAAGIAGAAATVLVFIAAQAGVDLTAEVAAAVTALLAFAAGYVRSD